MTDKESLTGIETEVQIEERTRHAMETYGNWLQNAMSVSLWSNVDNVATNEDPFVMS